MDFEGKVINTPPGKLMWCNIFGKGKDNYNKDGKIYTASIRLSGDDARLLRHQFDEILDQSPKGCKVKSVSYLAVLDEVDSNNNNVLVPADEVDSDHDLWEFQFKTNTTFPDGKPQTITVQDSKLNYVKLPSPIGNGSRGCLQGLIKAYRKNKNIGISAFLQAVQIIEYKPYETATKFAAAEGGYVGKDDTNNFVADPSKADENDVPDDIDL